VQLQLQFAPLSTSCYCIRTSIKALFASFIKISVSINICQITIRIWEEMTDSSGLPLSADNSTQFAHFANICEKIRGTTSKNMKVNFLSEYLSSLDDKCLPIAVLFLSNRIFPSGSKFAVNIGLSTIMQTLSEISILDQNQIQQIFLQYGDMGALSEYAVSKKHTVSLFQQQALTLSSIYDQFKFMVWFWQRQERPFKRAIFEQLATRSKVFDENHKWRNENWFDRRFGRNCSFKSVQ
jgi:hypothetical protein